MPAIRRRGAGTRHLGRQHRGLARDFPSAPWNPSGIADAGPGLYNGSGCGWIRDRSQRACRAELPRLGRDGCIRGRTGGRTDRDPSDNRPDEYSDGTANSSPGHGACNCTGDGSFFGRRRESWTCAEHASAAIVMSARDIRDRLQTALIGALMLTNDGKREFQMLV